MLLCNYTFLMKNIEVYLFYGHTVDSICIKVCPNATHDDVQKRHNGVYSYLNERLQSDIPFLLNRIVT